MGSREPKVAVSYHKTWKIIKAAANFWGDESEPGFAGAGRGEPGLAKQGRGIVSMLWREKATKACETPGAKTKISRSHDFVRFHLGRLVSARDTR